MVYRMGPAHFLLVVNASTIAKDYAWIREQVKSVSDAAVIDSSSRYALVAVQGPPRATCFNRSPESSLARSARSASLTGSGRCPRDHFAHRLYRGGRV